MLSVLPLLLSATLGSSDARSVAPNVAKRTIVLSDSKELYDLLDSPMRHVRTTDANVERLLRIGVARSPTFAGLISYLNASDVIVYIQPVAMLPTTLMGRLMLMPRANHQRYLRIQVMMSASLRELVAIIGHELRHAVEVADAPEVTSDSAMIGLYERIGMRSAGDHSYETDAARATAQMVRKELTT